MTLCPIAIAVGCQKCPAFKICPLKGLIGDKPKAPEPEAGSQAKGKIPTMPRASTPKTKRASKKGVQSR